MDWECDRNKARSNWGKHDVSFWAARRFEWDTAVEWRDDRPYPEVRTIALGLIGNRVHVLVYTRRGHRVRIISLRRAHPDEVCFYDQW